jgi:diguanylate cyclase (GGDEF)-like protein
VLATFDDVTQLESTSEELRRALDELIKSREEVSLQNEELKLLATIDPLTSCLNRRSFLERLDSEFAAARERGAALHCAMVDIDHFKAVNDGFGHAAGDLALQVVAGVLGTLLEPGEEICRFGGEEVCLLLRNREDDEAEAFCEVARRRLAMLEPGNAGLPPGLRVTASFGLVSIRQGAGSASALIDQADRALYASKSAGRNCVTVFQA